MPEAPENELDDEELITCMGCGRIVPNYVHFCPHCGTPLSSLSTIDPYKRAFAAGNMYWRVTHGPLSPIVVIGLMVMFGVSALTFVWILSMAVTGTYTDWSQKLVSIGFGVVALALGGAFWYRVFQNYRRQSKRGKERLEREDDPV